jgi:hypothetical protein
MSKACSVCSQPDALQERIQELHQKGESHREIENILRDEFHLKVSHSSIGRHLKNCLKEKSAEEEDPLDLQTALEELAQAPLDPDLLHQGFCRVLARSLMIFSNRLTETSSPETPYSVHLETFKCFETLVNIREKLYLKTNKTEEKNKEVKIAAAQFVQALTEDERRTFMQLYLKANQRYRLGLSSQETSPEASLPLTQEPDKEDSL